MPPHSHIYGIDGCPAGWLVLSQPHGNMTSAPISVSIYPTLDQLATQLQADDIVAIDMPIGLPIGLPHTDHYPRACDIAARQALGPRACCVFSAPCRGVLKHLDDYATACASHRGATGQGISCQAFNILPKIHELDQLLSRQPDLASFHEVHPEISFAHMNASSGKASPLLTKKSSPEGEQARAKLIGHAFPKLPELTTLHQQLGPKTKHGKTRWALNDLHDAFAALWSAHRIISNTARSFPSESTCKAPIDATGKTMLIQA